MFSIAGVTKEAGMVHPNVAITLRIICTDAPVTPAALQQLLFTAADKSYNCISIDGDTSTKDIVAMLANGAAGGSEIDFHQSAASQSDDFVTFQQILIEFMADMAKLVVEDGEGATKFIAIRIRDSPHTQPQSISRLSLRDLSSSRQASTARILIGEGC
jgi:glutamate N-acetyltransferase/amino-acid N-acetyltransferase